MFINYDKMTIFGFCLTIIFVLSFNCELLANRNQDNGLFHSIRNKELFEIERIEFKGNKYFTGSELESVIATRTTRRNTFHKIVEFYYFEFNKIKNVNSYLPPGAMNTLQFTLDRWAPEIQYYEEAKVEADLITLNDFYNQNGFHDIKIEYSFHPDSVKRKNVLMFFLSEGARYSMKSISISGLDSVSSEVKRKYAGKTKLKIGSPFNEDEVVFDVNTVQYTLLNNGYYYASYQQPVVTKDTIKKIDSITIIFNPGIRQKISSLTFVDSTYGQKIVTDAMKNNQLFFKTGDWYNRKAVEDSRQNLQALGTFELVNIDTCSKVLKFTDSTLPLQVFTQYRKQQEWGFGTYFNRTKDDKLNNAGLEGSYLNRNIGGIAQSLNLFTRFELKDLSRILNPKLNPEFEWQLGITYAQPFLWKIDNSRVGLSGQLLYTESKAFNILNLSTTSLSIKFPTKLPSWTYFNGLSFDFLIEWQNPTKFLSDYKTAMDTAKTDSAKVIVEETFKMYYNLYDETEKSVWIKPTALIFGFSMLGDTRNELFNPSSGYYTSISTDIWAGLGIAKYWRLQYTYNHFYSINKYTVFAWKARAGYIYWWDKENSYIPPDRQFFAGGANSNRGWASRHLRYFTDRILFIPSKDLDFAQDVIGSRGIVEGSFEIRWRFGKPRWTSDLVGEIINMGVMTGFFDWGNTFHWIAFNDEEYYSDMKFLDYLTGMAMSAGLGIGFQTPVGPFRVDFAIPVYDPTPRDGLDKFVLNRSDFLQRYWQFHVGLGYSF